MPGILRYCFIGLGQFGINAVGESKARIQRLRSEDGQSLLPGMDELPSLNPVRFLGVMAPPTDGWSSVFHRERISRSSDTILLPDRELVKLDAGLDAFLDTFAKNIKNLANLNHANYYDATSIQLAAIAPHVVVVLDQATLENASYKEYIEHVLDQQDERIRDRYQCSLLLLTARRKENQVTVENLQGRVRSLFLLGEDGNIIILSDQDHVDLATNLVTTLFQIPSEQLINLLSIEGAETACYGVGASHLSFPSRNIVLDSAHHAFTRKAEENLAYPDESLRDEFHDLFVGKLEPVTKDTEESPFSLGDHEAKASSPLNAFEDEHTEAYWPALSDAQANRGQRIADRGKAWITNRTERLREKINVDAKLDRIKQLTRADSFFDRMLETWHEQFEALRFLLQYNVIQNAEVEAEEMKKDFLDDWLEEEDELFGEARRIVEEDGKANSVHPGEITWQTAADLTQWLKTNLDSLQSPRGNVETPYKPAAAATESQVKAAMRRVPHPVSLVLRVVLFAVLMIVYWGGFHKLVFQHWLGWEAVPPLLTGVIFTSIFLFLNYWFGYRGKLLNLYAVLHSHLTSLQEEQATRISEIQNSMVADFYREMAVGIRERYGTRIGFFRHLVQDNPVDLSRKTTDLNTTERYYLNRAYLYSGLLAEFERIRERERNEALQVFLFDPSSEHYRAVTNEVAQQWRRYSSVLTSSDWAKAEASLALWDRGPDVIEDEASSAGPKSALTNAIRTFRRVSLLSIAEFIQHEKPEYSSLERFLSRDTEDMEEADRPDEESATTQVDPRIIDELMRRSEISFDTSQIGEPQPNPKIYTGIPYLLSEGYRDRVAVNFDRDHVVVMRLSRAESMNAIRWEA